MTRQADTESLVRYLVTSLVENPDGVSIARKESGSTVSFEVSVDADDVGKVIGRQGRIIKAIRTVVRAAASVNGDQVDIDVLG
ncbi:MAG: KH domain-containing protein [Coriobacteriia bacterium]|nr:KH domain-containing protein [Coriobacteriia bacterium]